MQPQESGSKTMQHKLPESEKGFLLSKKKLL